MFTALACVAFAVIGYISDKMAQSDPYGKGFEEDTSTYIRHSRQDLRLIAYLLAAILVMLGIIADRIH